MKYEFDGINTKSYNEQDRQNFMEYEFDNLLIDKTSFTVELDDKEVKLHLYIEDIDMSEYDNTDEHIISIGVVPAFESLSAKHQEDILSQFSEDDREFYKNNTDCLLFDSITYGFGIILRSETVTNPDDVEYKVNSAIAVRSAVSGLIGFELDRYMNCIGNTGWDFLSDYCMNVDLIKTAMARFEK